MKKTTNEISILNFKVLIIKILEYFENELFIESI